ncbi:MAG: hypothetical protein IPI67_38655 [Myxococcales bacterium]|nr:hypothetical protein [Myxococcales bacterium]
MLDVKDADFAPLIRGDWEEDIGAGKNFRTFVKLEGKKLVVTSHEMHADPNWPDHTITSETKEARVNDQKQFVVTGLWRVESNAKGYEGKKVEPSDFTYTFWPVSRDIVWFDEGRRNNWVKLVRAKKSEGSFAIGAEPPELTQPPRALGGPSRGDHGLTGCRLRVA